MTALVSPPRMIADVPDWRDLARMSDAELEHVDIAVMNLACAVGLPGSEAIDYQGCLDTLDRWAAALREPIDRLVKHEFRRKPAEYDHSEAVFRTVKMILGLQAYCGVGYNPAKTDPQPDDPYELADVFIHGAIQGPGGTCASLPVVYAAVGRRLGYPLKVVRVKKHMFNRWDDPATGERMNIEAATVLGVGSNPDDYYRAGRYAITPDQEREYGYLKSLTPRQELAAFIGDRAWQLVDAGRYLEAIDAGIRAGDLDAGHYTYPRFAVGITAEWRAALRARRPPGFPVVSVGLDPARRRWPSVPWELEVQVRSLEVEAAVLDDDRLERDVWGPLRSGRAPAEPVPPLIRVRCS